MIKIERATVTVLVSDLDRAIRFYTGLLNGKLIKRYGPHYAEIETPGVRIGLHPTAEPIEVGNNFSLGLGVPDLETAVATLREAGVDCEMAADGPSRLAHFADPDGNPLYLIAIES